MARYHHAADINGDGAVTQEDYDIVTASRGNLGLRDVPGADWEGSMILGRSIAVTLAVLLTLVAGCSAHDDDSGSAPTVEQHNEAVDEEQQVAHDDIPATPEDILRAAHARGELFRYRSVWPRDVPLLVDISHWIELFGKRGEARRPTGIDIYDCTLNHLGVRVGDMGSTLYGVPSLPYNIEGFGHQPIEVPPECVEEGRVQLHLRLWNRELEVQQKVVAFSLPITFTDSVHDILDEHVDDEYREQLRAAVATDTFLIVAKHSSNRFSISIPSPAGAEMVIALDVEFRVDGELLHTAQILCGSRCQSYRRMLEDGYQRVSFFLTNSHSSSIRRLDEDSNLTITLSCNPEHALYDVNAERVWKGEDIVLEMYSDPDSPDFWKVREVR